MKGILETAFNRFQNDVRSSAGHVKLQYIAGLIHYLQKNKFDAHVLIGGQNGVGKSMLLLALMKLIDPNSIQNNQMLYAFNKHGEFIRKIKTLRSTVLGIDEINVYFNYKQSMTTEQIALFNFIEIARERRVAIVSCCRDGRRVNNNYRDGKVSIYLWVIDRYEKGKIKTYAFVFCGSPIVEEQDKFMLSYFHRIFSFEQMRIIAEQLPTFYGYLFLDDIENYITKAELKEYEEQKEAGIQEVYNRWMDKLDKKEGNTGETFSSDELIEGVHDE